MTIYYPKHHCNTSNKAHLFPLIGFLEKKVVKDFQIVDDVNDSDVVLLPLTWNYYHNKGKLNVAITFIKKINALGKVVYTYNAGDNGVNVPKNLNVIIFRNCGDALQKTSQEKIIPFFLTDPLQSIFNQQDFKKRSYHNQPTVGFCGQANASRYNAAKEIIRIISKNVLYYIGVQKELPQKIQSTTFIRAKILKRIENSTGIKSNFIRRKQYRAGATTKKQRQVTTLEYYQNMMDSDYIVCIRGAGNFSVRLYETLAMGRIPVFINTNCMLPLDDIINWKEHMVWVDFDEIDKINDLILAHYNKMNTEHLNSLFSKNRIMWQEHLGMLDFFKKSFTHIEHSSSHE
ncbi:MAG: exostosin domain-containing protein [Winogradskyella sp.]